MVFVMRKNGGGSGGQPVLRTASLPIASVSKADSAVRAIAEESIGYGSDTTRTGQNISIGTSGQITNVHFEFDFSSIPQNAEIETVTLKVRGGKVTPQNSWPSYARSFFAYHEGVDSYSTFNGGTPAEFTETAGQVLTVGTTNQVSRADIANCFLLFDVCSYGGHLDGATMEVTYYA